MHREKREPLILACLLFWSVLVYYMIATFVLGSVHVVGESMDPTLQDGDELVMHRWPLYFREPKRGEIVVIKEGSFEDFLTVKRIIAEPHEVIHIRGGAVFLNEELMQELYLPIDVVTETGPVGSRTLRMLDSYYFVMGDNRDDSFDSRYYGPIHRDHIIGVVPLWHL